MKVRKPESSRPFAAGLLASLLCCLPTSNQHTQIPIGVCGVSTNFSRQAATLSGVVADNTVFLMNAVRCLLRARHKTRRRLRQALRAGSRQEFSTQPSSVGQAWQELDRLPRRRDHYPRYLRILPSYRIASFRPPITIKKIAVRNAAPQLSSGHGADHQRPTPR